MTFRETLKLIVLAILVMVVFSYALFLAKGNLT